MGKPWKKKVARKDNSMLSKTGKKPKLSRFEKKIKLMEASNKKGVRDMEKIKSRERVAQNLITQVGANALARANNDKNDNEIKKKSNAEIYNMLINGTPAEKGNSQSGTTSSLDSSILGG